MSNPGPDGAPDITVVICTRDRAERLRAVLASAVRLRVPPGLSWELLVVDNGSADATGAVARSFTDRLPIRLAREDTPGLSHARNRGVAEARGRYLCWTDDDVLLDAEWLAAYAAAFERHPDAAVFGGRITPVLEPPVSRWFARLAHEWPLTTVLAKRDFGEAPVALDLSAGVVPWGANYAVRAADQRCARYHPDLGVSPRQRRLGEEAEVIHQLLSAGRSGWWVPDAEVRHVIPAPRQTWRYVFDYFVSYGETIAYMDRHWRGTHHLSGNPREARRSRGSTAGLYLRALFSLALFGAARIVGATHRSLKFLVRAGFYAGAARCARASRAGLSALSRP